MNLLGRNMLIAALILGGFSLIGTGMVAFTHFGTQERIAASEMAALIERIHILIPDSHFDNDIARDSIEVTDAKLLGTEDPVTVYRARKNGQPVAVLLSPVAPDGYSGNIKLLVAIWQDGTVAGVRVINHKETPGLGDYIEETRSNWIRGFENRSLNDPAEDKWKVKKDNGDYDYVTGATITPRAVIKAVKNSLKYYQQHRDELFIPAEHTGEHAS